MQKLRIFLNFLILLNLNFPVNSKDYDVIYERFENIEGDEESLIEYRLHLTRQGHGDDAKLLINGYMVYNEDLGVDVEHMIKTSYSSLGTTQFRRHAYTLQKSDICEFFKTSFRKYGQSWVMGHTNFPYVPEEGICPLPKGNYTCIDVEFNEETYPSHGPRGLWKIEQIFEKKGKQVGGLRIYARVIDKV